MKWNIPKVVFCKIIPLFLLFLLRFFASNAQSSKPDYAWYDPWLHPAIRAMEAHDPKIMAFSKPGSNLVNLCIADTSAGIAYFVAEYGFIFDTLHLTPVRKKELQTAGKKANPFRWFETAIAQYFPVLQDAKDFLRENGSHFKKASYMQQRVLTLPAVQKAPSTLAKLLAIEEIERENKGILIHFSWYINWPKDTSVLNRLSEGKNPGSLIVHGTLESGYSEFINKELLSGVREARLDHATGEVWLYDWKNKAVDSFVIKKSKVGVLVQEKTDVFALYRAWLEWNYQNLNTSVPAWQYAANCELLKSKEPFLYAGFTGKTSNRTVLAWLQKEKKKVLDKIEALSGPDPALFSTIIAHPRYDGYKETRQWDVESGNWAISTTFTRGNKRYELTDHRGNVMATVSDRKIGIDLNTDGKIDAYEADITTATDYYPFGSLMPGRKYAADDNYRYGFNGKENDNDVKGEGNQQDYGMRIYDPRVGRFLSVDPLTKSYPQLTPYQFASNSPITSIDLDGLEGFVATGSSQPFSNNSRPMGMIVTVQDAGKINQTIVVTAFKAPFSEQLPKKLIDHYAYGNGKPYTLNKTEAVAIKSMPTGLSGIVEADRDKFETLIAGAKKGSEITLPKGYSIQGAATTGGTLGRFTILLTGKVIIDKTDVKKWTFEGTMQFRDVWDFKTTPVTSKDIQRSEWGEIQNTLGEKFMPGQGFTVTSEVIPVKQKSSDASFDWYDGKSGDGKQNEISNDMKDHPKEGKEAVKKAKGDL